jgi:hypothetical protein
MRALIVLAITFLTIATAHAQRHRYVENVYEGLLPAGAEQQSASLDRSALPQGRVAIIPSINFETHVRIWQEQHDQAVAGRSSTWRGEGGLAALESNDPRHFSDEVLAVVRPYFADAIIAQDLVEARERGADYFVIVDYFMRGSALNLRPVGGVRMLNASLEEVVSISHAPTVQWVRHGSANEAYQQSMARVFQAVVSPTLTDLRSTLGDPLERP